METVILTIHDETTKQEIFEFMKKFNTQEAELKFEVSPQNQEIEKHPFFGMVVDECESVEETTNRLRDVRT